MPQWPFVVTHHSITGVIAEDHDVKGGGVIGHADPSFFREVFPLDRVNTESM